MDFKLYAIRVYVTDWAGAIHFYTEVLEMPVAYRNDDIGWAELGTGDAKLALEKLDPNDAETQTLVGRHVGVSLQVKDIDSTYATLVNRGVDFKSPPEKQPWGGSLAHFFDHERNEITLLG